MEKIPFSIHSWQAWAPGLETRDDWHHWAAGRKEVLSDKTLSPTLEFVPSMQRRRMSQLTKMSLKVAYESVKEHSNLESVFASRYGEWNQTLELLKLIAAKEELSPAGFSVSVHNTSAGAYSLTTKNKSPYSAIAAGEHTFAAGLLEALGKLYHQDRVLFVIADEFVPKLYEPTFPFPSFPFGLALLLVKEKENKLFLNYSFESLNNKDSSFCSYPERIDALDFCKWLLDKEEQVFQTNSPAISIERNDKENN